MGAVVASASQPALAAIKLAWWRENFEKLDTAPPPAEPRLQAAADELLPRGISGGDLAELEEGWALLLERDNREAVGRGLKSRGATLFALLARLLGIEMDEQLGIAGEAFVAADLARRGLVDRQELPSRRDLEIAPRAARPLTVLAALARRDLESGPPFEAEATPPRAWAILRHRLTGR